MVIKNIIKVKRINKYSCIPAKANNDNGNLCYDVFCDAPFTLAPGEIKLIDTGLMVDMPNRLGIRILERSSSPLKRNIEIKAGTIDSNFKQFEVKIMAKKFEGVSLWTAFKMAVSKCTYFYKVDVKKDQSNKDTSVESSNLNKPTYTSTKFTKKTKWLDVIPTAWKLWKERNSIDEYKAGERIAQFMVVPSIECKFVEVNKIKKTSRKGGFGSTGK